MYNVYLFQMLEQAKESFCFVMSISIIRLLIDDYVTHAVPLFICLFH